MHALEMLSNDTYNISEIAYKIGFKDPQYFSRCFRMRFGLSPRKYRQQNIILQDSHNNSFLNQVNKTIENKLTIEDYDLDMFAKDMMMSKSTLYRRIKNATGYSPCEYIRRERIYNAHKLLNTSGLDLIDVANAVGFRDVKYFSRCFKDIYGKYPTQVIKERQRYIDVFDSSHFYDQQLNINMLNS
jgi:AraC-like DNA-binding protein